VVRAFGAEVRRRFGAPVPARLTDVGPGRVAAELPSCTDFDHVWLEEDLITGQRIQGHRVLADGEVIAEGSTVGATRIHLVGPQQSSRLEVELTGEAPRLGALRAHRTGVRRLEQVPDGYLAPTERPEN
jgi:alpha-L-fucosidase